MPTIHEVPANLPPFPQCQVCGHINSCEHNERVMALKKHMDYLHNHRKYMNDDEKSSMIVLCFKDFN